MKVHAIRLVLRRRGMFEAADLGVRLAAAHAGSIWRSSLPAFAVVLGIAAALLPLGAGWAVLAVVWLKPWLDRSLLFALSRAVFGESTRPADVWRARRSLAWDGLLGSLTMRRLSPWRAYVQPAIQLEGQRGAAVRERMRQLLGPHRAAALGMQLAFASIESALALGLAVLPAWLLPGADRGDLLQALFIDGDPWAKAIQLACYAGTVFFLEPFFVGAGFAMYLNRRVELEAWDVEQEFRLAFA